MIVVVNDKIREDKLTINGQKTNMDRTFRRTGKSNKTQKFVVNIMRRSSHIKTKLCFSQNKPNISIRLLIYICVQRCDNNEK
jgi:hypothetical protein